jgi:hypothetical protein
MSQWRYIYFLRPIGMDGPVKIGCSQSPAIRHDVLTAWSPFPLEIVVTTPGGLDLERNIHECLADLHSHGEWFKPDPIIDAIMAGLLAGKRIDQLLDLSRRKGTIRRGGWRTTTEEDRIHRRYSSAFRGHFDELPDEIWSIMRRWRRDGYGAEGKRPTDAEFAKLDQALTSLKREAA